MEAKIQKEFTLTVGTNEEGKTAEDMAAKAAELEQLGNKELGVRFHISEKEKNGDEDDAAADSEEEEGK